MTTEKLGSTVRIGQFSECSACLGTGPGTLPSRVPDSPYFLPEYQAAGTSPVQAVRCFRETRPCNSPGGEKSAAGYGANPVEIGQAAVHGLPGYSESEDCPSEACTSVPVGEVYQRARQWIAGSRRPRSQRGAGSRGPWATGSGDQDQRPKQASSEPGAPPSSGNGRRQAFGAGKGRDDQNDLEGPSRDETQSPDCLPEPGSDPGGNTGPNGQSRHRQNGTQPEAGETLGRSGAVGPGATRWIFSVASM